jgi:hypothetical protein
MSIGKVCLKCSAQKPHSSFYPSGVSPDWYMPVCISCIADDLPAWSQRRQQRIISGEPREITKTQTQSTARNKKSAFKSQQAEDAYLREKEKQNKNIHKGSFVYYCAWADRPDAVKIGYSTNVFERMKSFLTSSSSDLWLIAVQSVKGVREEQRLHNRFNSLRIRGEWFRFESDLLHYIPTIDQTLAFEHFQNFPDHYKSSIYVPTMASFIESNF